MWKLSLKKTFPIGNYKWVCILHVFVASIPRTEFNIICLRPMTTPLLLLLLLHTRCTYHDETSVLPTRHSSDWLTVNLLIGYHLWRTHMGFFSPYIRIVTIREARFYFSDGKRNFYNVRFFFFFFYTKYNCPKKIVLYARIRWINKPRHFSQNNVKPNKKQKTVRRMVRTLNIITYCFVIQNPFCRCHLL